MVMVKEAQAKYLTNVTEEQTFLKEVACPDGYKLTEVGVIPEGWGLCRLSDVVDKIVGGGTPSRSVSGYWGHDIPWVTVKDFATFNPIQSQEYITKKGLKNSSSNLIPKGVLITSTRMALGKAVVYEVDVTINQDLKAIFPINDLNTIFLYFWFQHNAGLIEELGSGSTVKGISLSDLRGMIFLKPSEIEQTAIAKTLSDVDALITSLEKLIAKKQAIKTATMQQLLTGKKRLPGFGEGKGYKQTELGEIPEDWEVVGLGDIGQNLIGLTYSPRDVVEHGSLVLRSSNVQKNKLAFNDNVFVKMDLPMRVIVKEGDILICVRNGSRQLIGKCALIDKQTEGSAFGAFMSIYRTEFSGFIFYQFQSDIIKNQINEIMGATINQITNKDMSAFQVPMPTQVEECDAIGSFLADMDFEIDSLENRLSKTQKIKQGMMQELLTGKTRLI